jgi:hypothetical protein
LEPILVFEEGGPRIDDPGFRVEVAFESLDFPTSLAFSGPDEILVLEKERDMISITEIFTTLSLTIGGMSFPSTMIWKIM